MLASRPAHACSCGRIATAVEARQYSMVVFEGIVVEKRVVLGKDRLGDETWTLPLEEYTFAVTRSWKGPAAPEIRLRQGYSNCDNAFSGGESYLVFASTNRETPSTYSSGKCGPTKRSSAARSDLAQLKDPTARFAPPRHIRSDLDTAYFVRLYSLFGMAAHLNAVHNWRSTAAWRNMGKTGIAMLLATLVAAGAAGVTAFRGRWRLAILTATLALFLATGSIVVSGATTLRSGFYTHYKEWKS
jgi:hypothetical protein